MSKQKYSPDFRDEAVRQILEGGHSTSEVAARLGVSANSLFKGAGLSDIPQLVEARPGLIFAILGEHGGIKPEARERATHRPSLEEREEIRAGLLAKMSIRAIGRKLKTSPSTISREVNRNRGLRWYKVPITPLAKVRAAPDTGRLNVLRKK